ncbi:hypothetical protein [Kistimonas asteriae]|uniref:hypothetical protein n=1 Tax=Kistimonas asteriae TaxID=517724 RepID=UPI001BA92BDC|nr:hypothetical protein [Kistimonas asteriae]
MGKVSSTGAGTGAASGLHKINTSAGKSKVQKARVGNMKLSVAKVKAKKSHFSGVKKLFGKIQQKLSKRSVQFVEVDVTQSRKGKSGGALFEHKTADALQTRNQHVGDYKGVRDKLEAAMGTASGAVSRSEATESLQPVLSNIRSNFEVLQFQPEVLTAVDALIEKLQEQKGSDETLQSRVQSEVQEHKVSLEEKESLVKGDTSAVGQAMRTDRDDLVRAEVDKFVQEKLEKRATAKTGRTAKRGQLATDRAAYGKAIEEWKQKLETHSLKKSEESKELKDLRSDLKKGKKLFESIEAAERLGKRRRAKTANANPNPEGKMQSLMNNLEAAGGDVRSIKQDAKDDKVILKRAKAEAKRLMGEAEKQIAKKERQLLKLEAQAAKMELQFAGEKIVTAVEIKKMQFDMEKVTAAYDKQMDEQLSTLQKVMPNLKVPKTTSRKVMAKESKAAHQAKHGEAGSTDLYAQVKKRSDDDSISEVSSLEMDDRMDDFVDYDETEPLLPGDNDVSSMDGVRTTEQGLGRISSDLYAYFQDNKADIQSAQQAPEQEKKAYNDQLIDVLTGWLADEGLYVSDSQVKQTARNLIANGGTSESIIESIIQYGLKNG